MLNTNKSLHKNPAFNYLIVGFLSPVVASLLLIPFAILIHGIFQISEMPIYAIAVTSGHVFAFLMTIYLLRKFINRISFPLLPIFLGWIVIVQIFWRSMSVGVSHLDCDNSCASNIIPQWDDKRTTPIVLIVLIITATLTFIYLRKIKNTSTTN